MSDPAVVSLERPEFTVGQHVRMKPYDGEVGVVVEITVPALPVRVLESERTFRPSGPVEYRVRRGWLQYAVRLNPDEIEPL